jgi:hypothetical protein
MEGAQVFRTAAIAVLVAAKPLLVAAPKSLLAAELWATYFYS